MDASPYVWVRDRFDRLHKVEFTANPACNLDDDVEIVDAYVVAEADELAICERCGRDAM